MKPIGKRNPDLRNGDENEFVDYEEELRDEHKSTTSGDSRTQTSHDEQRAIIPNTQPDDCFDMGIKDNENENDSQHEYISTSRHSDYSFTNTEYDGEGFLKSYIPFAHPKLDFGRARLGIDEKLVAFIKNEMVHNKKPEVDFTPRGFSILNKVYSALEKEEQDSFFSVLEHLNDSLTTALTACLHYSLVVKVIEQKWFWTDIATPIGITPPTNKPSMMFGKSSLYYIGHANIRATTVREIDYKAREHEKELEHILLKNSLDDCTRWKASFDKKFK